MSVIPAEAGIQVKACCILDSRFRGNDGTCQAVLPLRPLGVAGLVRELIEEVADSDVELRGAELVGAHDHVRLRPVAMGLDNGGAFAAGEGDAVGGVAGALHARPLRQDLLGFPEHLPDGICRVSLVV